MRAPMSNLFTFNFRDEEIFKRLFNICDTSYCFSFDSGTVFETD